MRNKLLYAVLAAVIFGASFAAAYAYALTSADRLKGESLMCLTPTSLRELRQAVDANDMEWAGSVKACVVTYHDYRVRVLQCSASNCLIRYFDRGGGIGYVEHRSLFKS